MEEPLSLTGAIDPHFFRFFSSCCIPLTLVDKCCRDPVSEENFLLWRTDNMWSSDPEDRAIVYIRKLAEDGLALDQVPSQSFFKGLSNTQESTAEVLLKGGWDGTGPEDWTAEAPWMIFR